MEDVLSFEARSLTDFFMKASLTGRGTPQEVSDRREGYFTNRLAKYFPPPVTFAKGNIEDIHGKRSQSIDCIMLSPAHPNLVDEDGKRAAILAEGTDFAVEVKPDLARKSEVYRGLQQLVSVKDLIRNRIGVLQKSMSPYHQIIPCAIVSEKTYPSVRKLIEVVTDFYVEHSVPRAKQVDIILVNNRFVAYNTCPMVRGFSVNQGFVIAEIGSASFALFLWFLHTWPKSEMTISSSVFLPYCKVIQENWTTYHDLNARLAELG